uniref:Uncharacterized protein n=1 Tax=Panagrolaimus sp. JU765 TaxID=591449 RepID=A0AC34Q596_9BILA
MKRDPFQVFCLFSFFVGSIQLQCFGSTNNETCKEGKLCSIEYSTNFHWVRKDIFKPQGCVSKDPAGDPYVFTCAEDFCNDPSKYTDVTGELVQPGQLKCYSSDSEAVGNLTTCLSNVTYCVVELSHDSDFSPVKINGRYCGKKEYNFKTMEKCDESECNSVKLRTCYYGYSGDCDSVFDEYHQERHSAQGVKSRNCLHLFYPNICVTRKLVSADGKECMFYDCVHSDASHLFYFKRNPTAKELKVKEGNFTMIITQCPEENCNEPAERFKGLKCWVGHEGNCTKEKAEQKPCALSNCDKYGALGNFLDDEPTSCFNESNKMYCRCSTNNCQKNIFEGKPIEISMAQKWNLLTIFWIIFLGFSFIFE